MTVRRVVIGIVVVLGAWGLAAGVSVGLASHDLFAAREALDDAEGALRASDLSEAREHLSAGRDGAARAAERLSRPWVAPLERVPPLGDDLRVVRILSVATRDVATSADELLAVADDIVHTEGQDASRGQVPLDYVERVTQPLKRLSAVLASGVREVEETGCEGVVSPIHRACRRFLEIAEPAVASARRGAAMAEVAPALLGRDRERRYLVFAASYSELRGSVGLLGSWAVMTADDGRLDIGAFHETADLPVPAEPVGAPSDAFERRFGRYGVLREWRNANMSMHLPDTATVLMELWARSGRAPLDGVIITSPLAVEAMVRHLGPLDVPDVTTLTARNARAFIGLDAYDAFESANERKRVLGAVAAAGFERMLDMVESNDVMASVEVLEQLVAGGDVSMYAVDGRLQQALVDVGMAGQVPEPQGEFAAVLVNNVAGNKVDYFTTRSVEHTVHLLPDGVTNGEVSVTFRNEAPRDGYSKYVLGPATQHTEAGDNLSLVSLYCGRACRVTDAPAGVRPGGRDGGLPVWDVVLRIASGQQRRVTLRTETPRGWYRDGSHLVVPVDHAVQPTLHETPVRVRVVAPDGWAPVGPTDGAEVVDGDLVMEVSGRHAIHFEARFTPVAATSGDGGSAAR